MRFIWLLGALLAWVPARAAPPPEASGHFHDWFQSLTVPGSSNTPCCTVADCRMVESRWNDRTLHYEAKVVRDVFSNALEKLSAVLEGSGSIPVGKTNLAEQMDRLFR